MKTKKIGRVLDIAGVGYKSITRFTYKNHIGEAVASNVFSVILKEDYNEDEHLPKLGEAGFLLVKVDEDNPSIVTLEDMA